MHNEDTKITTKISSKATGLLGIHIHSLCWEINHKSINFDINNNSTPYLTRGITEQFTYRRHLFVNC